MLFLLLQPAPGKPWGFPKGKLDVGETEEQAARREIAEESGLTDITLDVDFQLIIHYTYRRGRSVIKKEVTYYIARTATAAVHISWEHVAYQWVTLENALDLVSYENARDALRKAYAHLIERHGYPGPA